MLKSEEINLIVEKWNDFKCILDKYPLGTFKVIENKEEGLCLEINLDY